MTNDKTKRARMIFLELSTLDPSAMQGELDRLTDGDRELRDAVIALLDARAAADDDGFMDSPTASINRGDASESAGAQVGPYKLLQAIGEGGFGTVFLAEQVEPVRRRVALKIIKLGMDTRQVIARFEAERQALALMDHPHIARVFDAGATDSGRPYFAMEYVVGDAITTFADAYKLDIPARLALFAQVCSAVQHAHTKGVIHRDLKPANVLVSMVDGKPFAKVIDFGIAKATASPLTEKTLFTEHRQLIGTPEYMSPEQADGSPDIDTRTDVYALGVLLYELLTGATPFEARRLRSAAWGEMQRIIREEDPPAPSLRLSRNLDTLARTAAARSLEPTRLSAAVRGELDWVVMKALEKERARRYDTPAQIADDLGRHLRGEPVVAAPPSRAYRAKKFVRRNRRSAIAVAAVAATLLIGIAGTTWGMLQARRESAANLAHQENIRSALNELAAEIYQEPGATGEDQANAMRMGAASAAREFWGREFKDPLELDLMLLTSTAVEQARKNREHRQLLTDERDRLRGQNAIAVASIENAVKRIMGSDLALDASPRLPGDSDWTLVPTWSSGKAPDGEPSDAAAFQLNKEKEPTDGMPRVVVPLAPDEVLPAMAEYLSSILNFAIDANEQLIAQRDAGQWQSYVASLELAMLAIESDRFADARQWLARCPETLRGWEWRLLHERARSVRSRHFGSRTGVSPNGDRVATVDGAAVNFLDIDGNRIGGVGLPAGALVWSGMFSKDGATCAIRFDPDDAPAGDVESTRLVAVGAEQDWTPVDIPGRPIAIAPDGSSVVIWSQEVDATSGLFDRSGRLMVDFGRDLELTYNETAAFAPRGETLIASAKGGLAIVDVAAESARILPVQASLVTWSPSGRRFALSTGDAIHLYSRSGELELVIPDPDDRVTSTWLEFAGENRLVAGKHGYDIAAWDLTGKEIARVTAPARGWWDLAVAPTGTHCAATSNDETLIMNLNNGAVLRLDEPSYAVPTVAFTQTGAAFAVHRNGVISIRDLKGDLLERIELKGADQRQFVQVTEDQVVVRTVDDYGVEWFLASVEAFPRPLRSPVTTVTPHDVRPLEQADPTRPAEYEFASAIDLPGLNRRVEIHNGALRIRRLEDGEEVGLVRLDRHIEAVATESDAASIVVRATDGAVLKLNVPDA